LRAAGVPGSRSHGHVLQPGLRAQQRARVRRRRRQLVAADLQLDPRVAVVDHDLADLTDLHARDVDVWPWPAATAAADVKSALIV
jgi:hypothetical protein